jgi:hypothetical protein
MPSYIPKLARFAARRAKPAPAKAAGPQGGGANRPAPTQVNVEYVAELVPILRRRLDIAPTFSDEAILASLASIATRTSHQDRWRAASGSTLGLWLSSHGKELNAALITILALLPKPPR